MTIFDPSQRRVVDVPGGTALRLIGLAFIGLLIVILLFSAVTRVDSGAVGVLTLFGRVTGEVLPEGLHLINPFKTNHETSFERKRSKKLPACPPARASS